jgi:hypothetical protein
MRELLPLSLLPLLLPAVAAVLAKPHLVFFLIDECVRRGHHAWHLNL